MMSRIVTFGELMLRLNPQSYLRFVQSDFFLASYAGAEANVAVSLANFGLETSFITKLPQNEIGQAALNAIQRYGVHTDQIIRGGKRLGIYFIEKGASQRASKVIYDREHSAFAEAQPCEYNWREIFKGAEWYHFTGITPALNDSISRSCLEACKTAKEMGLQVSCDINYRKNLWSREKASEVMGKLMPYVDLCIANEEDAFDVFGISADDSDVAKGKLSYNGYKKVAKLLADKFKFQMVAITLRTSYSANDNDWAGILYSKGNYYTSNIYPIHIVDRVGGGDSFAAGLIYALVTGKNLQYAVDFAAAASCLKHTIENDFNLISITEVETLLKGNTTGRVQR